ncbi:MAG TPA: hypothetical protein VMG62_06865 [Solirubrobacteraceae bacterium]|nr:hypothetical protein [Solirubrobacteraceae bacterium]
MSAVTIDELLIADEPAPWIALGFAVQDDVCAIGAVHLRFVGRSPGRGIAGWSLRELASTALDGLLTTRSREPVRDPKACAQPNGVAAIDHVVAISPALDRTIGALQSAGLALRRIREEPTPAGAPRQAFFRLGGEILEVIQMPVATMEQSGGAERPARFWGLAVIADDLESTVAGMAGKVSEIRAAVQPERRIATLSRAAGLAVPLAIMSSPAPAGARS